MTAYVSDPDDLALHGPRVLGFTSPARVASLYRLDVGLVTESLLDHEARGRLRHSRFADTAGWSVTDRGRIEDERRMAAELDRAGAREAVLGAHAAFVPLNRRFTTACTSWQVRPVPGDPMALNDHTDYRWDQRVVATLTSVERSFAQVAATLAGRLERFDGYADRYSAAMTKVRAGSRRWVDSPEVDSCHTVWIQFHEDVLATLGIPRGSDA
jgi:hypothetical protein